MDRIDTTPPPGARRTIAVGILRRAARTLRNLWPGKRPAPTRRPLIIDPAARHRTETTLKNCAEDYAIGQQQRADAARALPAGSSR